MRSIYVEAPPEKAFIFLIDLHSSAFQTKMLFYLVSAAKEVLSREEMNETQIYFFTYDEVVHEYDFSGDEVKCTILDPSIKNSQQVRPDNFLGNIRVLF